MNSELEKTHLNLYIIFRLTTKDFESLLKAITLEFSTLESASMYYKYLQNSLWRNIWSSDFVRGNWPQYWFTQEEEKKTASEWKTCKIRLQRKDREPDAKQLYTLKTRWLNWTQKKEVQNSFKLRFGQPVGSKGAIWNKIPAQIFIVILRLCYQG
jgi:hypothetical protein